MLVLLPLPILFFPDGRISRRWRWTLYVYAALMAVLVGSLVITDLGAFTDRVLKIDSSGELKQLGTGGTRPRLRGHRLPLRRNLALVGRPPGRRLPPLPRRPATAVEVAAGRRLVRGLRLLHRDHDRLEQQRSLLGDRQGRLLRADRAADLDRDRDPALPAVRHRPADLAHALLRAPHRAARRRLRRARAAHDARAAVLLAGRRRRLDARSPRRSSAPCAAACSGSSTAASTAPATTPRRPSPRSAPACATPSIRRPSSASSPPPPAARSSRRTSRSGSSREADLPRHAWDPRAARRARGSESRAFARHSVGHRTEGGRDHHAPVRRGRPARRAAPAGEFDRLDPARVHVRLPRERRRCQLCGARVPRPPRTAPRQARRLLRAGMDSGARARAVADRPLPRREDPAREMAVDVLGVHRARHRFPGREHRGELRARSPSGGS